MIFYPYQIPSGIKNKERPTNLSKNNFWTPIFQSIPLKLRILEDILQKCVKHKGVASIVYDPEHIK